MEVKLSGFFADHNRLIGGLRKSVSATESTSGTGQPKRLGPPANRNLSRWNTTP